SHDEVVDLAVAVLDTPRVQHPVAEALHDPQLCFGTPLRRGGFAPLGDFRLALGGVDDETDERCGPGRHPHTPTAEQHAHHYRGHEAGGDSGKPPAHDTVFQQ